MSPKTAGEEGRRAGSGSAPGRGARKQVLVRLDPKVHAALAKWASDDLRSLNAQVEIILREALRDAGRLPKGVGPIAPRGRPRLTDDERNSDGAAD